MEKNIENQKKKLFYAAVVSLIVSIASSFTSVFSYITPEGDYLTFNIFDLLNGTEFTRRVLIWYEGTVFWEIDSLWVSVFSIISVLSLVLAIAGLVTLRQQRPNIWQFSMTITALIGTALPALLILSAVLVFGKNFPGTLRFGIYPIVSPIATLISVLAVHRKKNIMLEEQRKEMISKGKLWSVSEDDLL